MKLKAISDRVTKNKSKDLFLDNELKTLKTFDTDYFVGKNYFEGGDGAQNTLVFQVKNEFFGYDDSGYNTWKSKGVSDQNLYCIRGVVTTKLIRPTHIVTGADEYFIQNSSRVIPNNGIINFYIVYKLLPKNISTDNALKNCLFGVVDATRADDRVADPDKFIYSGYRIGFDHTRTFTHPESNLARNVIIFGADMSGSVHASNKTQKFMY